MSIQHAQAASPTNALARGDAIGDGRAGPGHGEPRAEEEARRRAGRPAARAAGVPGQQCAASSMFCSYLSCLAATAGARASRQSRNTRARACPCRPAPACHHGTARKLSCWPFCRAETYAFRGGVLLFGCAASRLATATQRRRVRVRAVPAAGAGVPDRPGEDGVSFTVRARVILNRRMALVRLGSVFSSWRGNVDLGCAK